MVKDGLRPVKDGFSRSNRLVQALFRSTIALQTFYSASNRKNVVTDEILVINLSSLISVIKFIGFQKT